ncbi:MAG: PKD domain-containing protein, partial [Bacteroidales bacterium]|nr:PKD domain-containing protein [Bacteroidales bacterium]
LESQAQYFEPVFQTAGEHTVELTLTNYCGFDTTISKTFTVSNGFNFEDAEIEAGNDVSCPGSPVDFYVNNIDNSVSVAWDFGDGNTAQGQEASNTYLGAGTYNVTAILASACGNGDTLHYTHQVSPDAQISSVYSYVYPQLACPGESVTLSASTYNGYTYQWKVGDTTINSGNGYISFNDPGVYQIHFTAANGCGSTYTNTEIVTVNSLKKPGINNVNLPLSEVCPGTRQYLYAGSNNSVYQYRWKIGEELDTVATYFYYTFNNAGTYNVEVLATNNCGTDTFKTAVLVGDLAHLPYQEIYTSTPLCIDQGYIYASFNQNVNWFVADTHYNNTSYLYHYFDTSGLYEVSAQANFCGKDTTYKTFVEVVEQFATSEQHPTLYYDRGKCPGEEVYIYTYASNYDSIRWSMDGQVVAKSSSFYHTFEEEGIYPVHCTIYRRCNTPLEKMMLVTISTNSPADYPYIGGDEQGCPNQPVSFYSDDDYKTYKWSFGDGGTSTAKEPSHIYKEPGSYNVTLTVTNYCGNSATVSEAININNNVEIDDLYLEYSADAVCPGDQIAFYADGDNGLEYSWDFGNGATKQGNEVSYAYNSVGDYQVTLTGTNGCGNTKELSEMVSVQNDLPVSLNNYDYGFLNNEVCPGEQISYYVWPAGTKATVEFADQATLTKPSEVIDLGGYEMDVYNFTFNDPGNYNTKLEITNSCGNSASTNYTAYVSNNAEVDADMSFNDNASNCACEQITFTAYGGSSYKWDFGDGSVKVDNNGISNVKHVYKALGTYTVKVEVSNDCGDYELISDEINIGCAAPGCIVGQEERFAQEIRLYPNPANQLVNIVLGTSGQASKLNVYSYTGKRLMNHKVTGPVYPLDISALSPGIYIVELTQENQRSIMKLVVE